MSELDDDAARKITDALNEAGDLIEAADIAEALNKHFSEWEWTLWSDGQTDSETMKKEGWQSALEEDDAWRIWEIVYRSTGLSNQPEGPPHD